MKYRSLITTLTFLALLSISLTTRIILPVKAQEPEIFVYPATVTANQGETFTVSINVTGVTSPSVAAWEVKLGFNTEVLSTNTELIDEEDFLSSAGSTQFQENVLANYAQFGAFMLEPGGATGSGTLATVQFQVLGPGRSTLDLFDTQLIAEDSSQITHTVEDGQFYTPNPKADFIYYPSPQSWGGRIPEPYRNPVVDETVTFNATYDPPTQLGSKDWDGTIVDYAWDFGDDSPPVSGSDALVVTHSYAQTGNYNVNLTVTDNDGLTGSIVRPLTIDIHDIAVTNIQIIGSTTVRPGTLVSINVTVTNQGTVNEYFNVTTYYDDNPIWYNKTDDLMAFSLPMEEDPVSHLPPAPPVEPNHDITITFVWNTTGVVDGTYTINATSILVDVKNPSMQITGEVDTADNTYQDGTVTIFAGAPVASFSFSPVEPIVNQPISFDASASSDEAPGYITGYAWDFGDGGTGSGVTTTHSYTAPGTYTVTLKVTDNDGLESTVWQGIVVAKETSMISLTASPETVTFGETITLQGVITPTRVGEDVTIRFRVQGQEGWTDVSTVQTGENGDYTYQWTPAVVGEFELRASWLGDANTLGSVSAIISVTVDQRDSSIQIDADPVSVTRGESVTINGTLSPQLAQVTITIQFRIGVGAWTDLATATTDSNGHFTYAWQTTDSGSFSLKATWEGDSNTFGADSNVKTVDVEAEKAPSPFPIEYIVGGVVIVVILIAAVAFFKLRKH